MTIAATDRDRWTEARAHLARAEPRFAPIIQRVGPCLLAPRTDYFVALCQSIISQQISTAAARTVGQRFRLLFPRRRPTPPGLLALDEPTLRSAGLSRQKAAYLRDLAAHFVDGRVPVRRLRTMDDEAIIESLTEVKGIGRWTVEMFLIFVLNRADVLPVDDLGLRVGVQRLYNLRERPDARRIAKFAEPWRPYRSVATWYLWRSLAAAPL